MSTGFLMIRELNDALNRLQAVRQKLKNEVERSCALRGKNWDGGADQGTTAVPVFNADCRGGQFDVAGAENG